jgi:hypothetical protein
VYSFTVGLSNGVLFKVGSFDSVQFHVKLSNSRYCRHTGGCQCLKPNGNQRRMKDIGRRTSLKFFCKMFCNVRFSAYLQLKVAKNASLIKSLFFLKIDEGIKNTESFLNFFMFVEPEIIIKPLRFLIPICG